MYPKPQFGCLLVEVLVVLRLSKVREKKTVHEGTYFPYICRAMSSTLPFCCGSGMMKVSRIACKSKG